MMRVILVWLLLGTAAAAVQPDEILSDPALEARAREISKGLRCLVCRNESIDESNADLAQDLRVLVRERLVEGDSDEEVVNFVVARYGEYVLLQPQANGANLILYIAGPVVLLGAVALSISYVRRRKAAPEIRALTDEEKLELSRLLDR